jgi:hypothetical protein
VIMHDGRVPMFDLGLLGMLTLDEYAVILAALSAYVGWLEPPEQDDLGVAIADRLLGLMPAPSNE